MGYTDEDIGFQDNDASEAAAKFNASGKITLREQVRQQFSAHKSLTVEQVISAAKGKRTKEQRFY